MSDQSMPELPPQWSLAVATLRVSVEQLLLRLAAMEQSGVIGDEAAKAYAEWVTRLRVTLEHFPKE